MATASDLIESTRRYLFSGQSEQLNRLSAAINASVQTFVTTYALSGIQAGAVVSIDLEDILILQVNTTTSTVSDAQRGWNGTTAASHAINAIVTVNPKFTNFRVLEALNNDLLDLSAPDNGLYRIQTIDLTFNPVKYGYDLAGATDIISIAEVRFRMPGPTRTWPLIKNYALTRDMPTTGTFGDFPSGFGLILYQPAYPGFPIRVRYKAPLGTLVNLTDDLVTTTGINASAVDLPPIGAAIRLVAGREIKRSFDEAQGEPRRAEETPPQSQLIGMKNLQMLRQARIHAEVSRLQRRYGYVLVGAG